LISPLPVKSDLYCYFSDQIDDVWAEVGPHIQRALDRFPQYCLDDIYEGLCNKSMQLWVWRGDKIHAAMVTTIQTQNDKTYCLLLAVGGDKLTEWSPYLHLVEIWAKEQGCTELAIYGRHGWARQLKFDIEYTKMIKRI
jgi:hypothetical protein